MSPDSDWQLAQGTVDARNEDYRSRLHSNVRSLPAPTCSTCGDPITGAVAWTDDGPTHPIPLMEACHRRALRRLADGDDVTRRVKP